MKRARNAGPPASGRGDRVYLTGFMGSGKSTIGPILANALGYSFVDVDSAIEKEEGRTVAEIFRLNGEEYFRGRERAIIARSSRQPKTVIALGGGALTDRENFRTIAGTGVLVYIKVSLEHLVRRLQHRADRPLLTDESGTLMEGNRLQERIAMLQKAREPFYEKADITVLADEKRIGLTVDRIVRQLSSYLR